MKNLRLKIMLMTIVMAFITAFTAQPLWAQSSYLDTIYQAVEGEEGVAIDNEALAPEDDGTVVIDTGDKDAKVTVSDDLPAEAKEADDKSDTSKEAADKEQEALAEVNLVLADMTRILIGMNLGVPIKLDSFTVIDLTGSSDKPADDDKKDDEKPADDDKKDDEKPADDEKETAETVDDLKSKIESTYNIKCSDGTSSYTVRQLQLIDEVLGKLPSSFRENTTEIIRDKENTEDKDSGNTLGYVIKPQSKVHILDLAAHYSESNIQEMEKAAGRTLTETEVVKSLEFQYARTIAHEMTHCFSNRKGASVVTDWADKFWADGKNPTGSLISTYAKTSYEEDMAESVSFYVMGGVITQVDGKDVYKVEGYSNYMDIDRYNFIKNNIMGGKEYRTDIEPGKDGISI